MVAWDMHADWAYEGGAFRLADNLAWGIQMAAEAARRRQDFIAHQALYAASRNLPLDEELPTHPRVLRGYARYSHYDDWLGNPLPGQPTGTAFRRAHCWRASRWTCRCCSSAAGSTRC